MPCDNRQPNNSSSFASAVVSGGVVRSCASCFADDDENDPLDLLDDEDDLEPTEEGDDGTESLLGIRPCEAGAPTGEGGGNLNFPTFPVPSEANREGQGGGITNLTAEPNLISEVETRTTLEPLAVRNGAPTGS